VEGLVVRVGGTQAIPIDVRVVCSTLRDLARLVENGEFRADLYYRIGGFEVAVPPLRERVEDVPLLAKHFLEKHALRYGREGISLSSRALRQLTAYSWPGNVRELEHVIERALITSEGPRLDLAEPLAEAVAANVPQPGAWAAEPGSLRDMDRSYITWVLEKTHWVIEGSGGAAKLLNVPPSTLRSRMKKLGIARSP
jgi:formate hydrogenlyase transcriptional activator